MEAIENWEGTIGSNWEGIAKKLAKNGKEGSEERC